MLPAPPSRVAMEERKGSLSRSYGKRKQSTGSQRRAMDLLDFEALCVLVSTFNDALVRWESWAVACRRQA